MSLSSELEVRVAALHAAVFHHKTVAGAGAGHESSYDRWPAPASSRAVLATAREFEQFIQGDDA